MATTMKDSRIVLQKRHGCEQSKQVNQDRDSLESKEIKGQRQLTTEVMEYWFLLDKDVVKAPAKGNYKLLKMIGARVDYLLKVLDSRLVLEGVKGEEEALWSIHKFLHNNGWWAKTENLKINELGIESRINEVRQ